MTVSLRRVSLADSDLLFRWVNEPDALAGKLLTVGLIARGQHEKWFAARLADPETFMWIIQSGRKPVGQLRLMKNNDAYEVDIYVIGEQRGSGIAREALTDGIGMLSRERPGLQTIRARVKPGNERSQRLFDRAGFGLVARHKDHLVYELTTQ